MGSRHSQRARPHRTSSSHTHAASPVAELSRVDVTRARPARANDGVFRAAECFSVACGMSAEAASKMASQGDLVLEPITMLRVSSSSRRAGSRRSSEVHENQVGRLGSRTRNRSYHRQQASCQAAAFAHGLRGAGAPWTDATASARSRRLSSRRERVNIWELRNPAQIQHQH